MFNFFSKILLACFAFFLCGQSFAACNLSFTTTVGGQVTKSGSEYKYTFSTADYANCDPGGQTDGQGSSLGVYVDAIGNQNSNGNKTFPSSSVHGTNNVYIMSIGGSLGPTNIDAFYYTPPVGYSGADSFVFYDFNSVPYTVNVTVVPTTTAPDAPTIGTATAGNTTASVAFTAPASDGGSAITGYNVTSNPVGGTANGISSPIDVTGLTNGVSYTFTVTATNAIGTSSASGASNAVVPKAPQTITFTNPGAKNFGTSPTITATASSGLTPTFTSTTTGICTITSGGVLTFVTTGNCTINADQAGNAAYQAATTVPQTFAVNAVVPDAPSSPVGTAGDAQVSVAFIAPVSNGGSSITGYTVTASPGGATGTGSASPIIVAGLTNGTAYTFTVTATNSAGTSSASSASAAVTPKSAQTITFTNPGAKNFGTSPTLTATASSGLTPTFTSTTTGICTITSGGVLTFVTTGNCTINADQAGNAVYQAATTVSRTFAVNAVVPDAPSSPVGTAGSGQVTVAFTAPVSNGGSSITSYTVTASPGGFTGSGAASPIIVAGLANGTAYTFTVTATNSAGTSSASSASAAVTPKSAQTITFTNPGAKNFGTTPTLTATATSGLTPTFTSATTGICTITSGGALTFVTAGNCTINADQAGNGTYLAATTVSQTFAVNAVVPGAPTSPVGTAGNGQISVAFTAPVSNGGSAIIDYTVTSNPSGFSATGAASPLIVSGLTNGTPYTFTVTARNVAGSSSASTASAAVTPKAPQTITFTNPGAQNFGTTPSLTATTSSGLTATFTSITTSICTVTSGGALTFITAGNCTINADQAGNGTYLPATTISRTFSVNPVISGAPTSPVGTAGNALVSVAFSAPSFNGGATITGYSVTSSPGGLTGTGAASPVIVNGLTNGTAYTFTVTATNLAGTSAASTASAAVTPKAPQTITFTNPGTQTLGTPLTVTATASSGLTVTFTSSTPGICSVTPGGAVSSISAGVCTISANQAGNTNYAAATTVTQSFSFTPLPVGTITFATPTSANVLLGNTLTNVATSSLSGGSFGAISYTSSNLAVATVNSAGVATPVGLGTTVITATQAAVAGVNAASSQSYTLTVVPGSYSGPTSQGAGAASISGAGSGSCGFASAQFTPSSAIGTLPPGTSAAESAFQFDSTNCGTGGTVTITVTYPQPLPFGTMIYKYGPQTPGALTSSWFLLTGATLSADRRTITYTVTDNGVGDSNPAVGVITDPVVPLVPFGGGGTASIPTLSEYGLMLLAGLMGMLGIWGQRRRGRLPYIG